MNRDRMKRNPVIHGAWAREFTLRDVDVDPNVAARWLSRFNRLGVGTLTIHSEIAMDRIRVRVTRRHQ